jgi:hypothetical protein
MAIGVGYQSGSDELMRRSCRSPRVIGTVPLLLLSLGLLPSGARAEPARPVHTYELQPNIAARIGADGQIVVVLVRGDEELPLLRVEPPVEAVRQRGGPATVFAGAFSECDPGGRRGVAPDADDDADGLADEDPVDGRDNDGDGRIDEDFAAVSDTMVVVDVQNNGQRFHLETYHWGYSHLSPTILMDCRAGGADLFSAVPAGRPEDTPDGGSLTLRAAGGGWREVVDWTWRPHAGAARPGERTAPLYVCAVTLPATTGDRLWLGVTRLDRSRIIMSEHDGGSGGPREPLADHSLEQEATLPAVLNLPLDRQGSALALSVASTELQLRWNLAAAHAVHEGARERQGERVPWVVPPLCALCQHPDPPIARLLPSEAGWSLELEVGARGNGLIDPSRCALAGRPLGCPFMVTWRRTGSTRAEEMLPPFLELPGFIHHGESGQLILHFLDLPDGPPAQGAPLKGWLLSGRPWSATLQIPAGTGCVGTETDGDADQATRDGEGASGRRGVMLSPDLLTSFPNPFSDRTRLHYRVPALVGEGFDPASNLPAGLDAATPMPYRSSSPLVSLKVYRVNGQEVASLQEASLGPGEYQVSWDGCEADGRPVASGTYFCKLQIEDWCVTKRLVYVR